MKIGMLDTESTGADTKKDRIIEIALQVYDERGGLIHEIEKRINPKQNIAPGALKVHGISNADVAFEPTFEEIAPTFGRVLEMCDLIVWHNGDGFDGPLIREEFKRVDVPISLPPSFDTMLNGRGMTADGKVPTLGELCWSLNVPYDKTKAHAALYDVAVMAQAYFNAIKYGYWKLPEAANTLMAA